MNKNLVTKSSFFAAAIFAATTAGISGDNFNQIYSPQSYVRQEQVASSKRIYLLPTIDSQKRTGLSLGEFGKGRLSLSYEGRFGEQLVRNADNVRFLAGKILENPSTISLEEGRYKVFIPESGFNSTGAEHVVSIVNNFISQGKYCILTELAHEDGRVVRFIDEGGDGIVNSLETLIVDEEGQKEVSHINLNDRKKRELQREISEEKDRLLNLIK